MIPETCRMRVGDRFCKRPPAYEVLERDQLPASHVCSHHVGWADRFSMLRHLKTGDVQPKRDGWEKFALEIDPGYEWTGEFFVRFVANISLFTTDEEPLNGWARINEICRDAEEEWSKSFQNEHRRSPELRSSGGGTGFGQRDLDWITTEESEARSFCKFLTKEVVTRLVSMGHDVECIHDMLQNYSELSITQYPIQQEKGT